MQSDGDTSQMPKVPNGTQGYTTTTTTAAAVADTNTKTI